MATDAVSLNNQGLMYSQQTAPQWQLMKLALLSQILLKINPMAAVDPTTLLNEASQYTPYGPQCLQLMELALLAQILTNGVNVAAGGMTCGNYAGGVPSFTPLPPGSCALGLDTSNGHLWIYLNGSWHDTGILVGP